MFFLAYQRLPLADVTVISQAVPIFSCILAIIFLKEIITPKVLVSLFAVVVGIYFVKKADKKT